MGKIILFVLGLLLAYWLLKDHHRKAHRDQRPRWAGGAEDMVRCAHCGVHLPRSESITTRGAFYCSVEHQRQHKEPD